MKKLKVIQIIDSLNTGGAEVLACNIASLLVNEKIESHLCVTRKEGDLKNNINFDKVNYIFLNRRKTLDLKAIFKLKRYIKKNKIAILHAHSSSYFIAFCVKIILPNIKLIWHDHYGNSEFLGKRKKFPLIIFSFFFDSIITVNKDLKKWATSYLNSRKVYQLDNFVHFVNNKKVTFLKGINRKRIVHLAGFREQKDHLTLLNAFQIIIKKEKDWTLHLVGKVYNDEYSNSIFKFIEENNLKNNVFIYNSCIDIKHILSQSTIGVLSSKSEGLPVALLEYGFMNLPVIVTNVGNCIEVVKHENAIVDSQRSDKFAIALLKIIKNEKLLNQIKNELNNNVLENYTANVFLRNIINIYKS